MSVCSYIVSPLSGIYAKAVEQYVSLTVIQQDCALKADIVMKHLHLKQIVCNR